MSREQFLDTIADLQCAIYYSGEEFLSSDEVQEISLKLDEISSLLQ
jgi:hypothetical protein